MSKRMSMDGVTALNDTPTTTKVSNTSNDSSTLDDINYLLYLETLKRFNEEKTNLSKRVEEKSRQYEEAKAIYRSYYELYVQLYQAAITRGVLESTENVPEAPLNQAKSDIEVIAEKVNNNKIIAYFKPEVLETCRETVRNISNHDEAQEIQAEMIHQKATVKVIRSLNEAIQLTLETATTQSLDYFVELIQTNQLDNQSIRNESQNDVEKLIIQNEGLNEANTDN